MTNAGFSKMLVIALSVSIGASYAAGTYPINTSANSGVQAIDASNVHNTKVETISSYIIQGAHTSFLTNVVAESGGEVSGEFPIINAISANLTSTQAELIAKIDNLRVEDDRSVHTMSSSKEFVINNSIAQQTGASVLHERGLRGQGVTVAVIDSGTLMGGKHGLNLRIDSENRRRDKFQYDAIEKEEFKFQNNDENGHGTHVTGIISSSLKSKDGHFNGIAPDIDLVSIKAFDESGASTYSIVLEALNWLYENHDAYGIRVLNLSLGAMVQSNYWDDPINQAVMKLWDAGVVVITSAGNLGDKGMGSVTVPGNTPYIITVGAATDNGTPFDFSDDRVASFSSMGPTFEGFVKPEVVSWGGSVESKVRTAFADSIKVIESKRGEEYGVISGTSQAAAIVSGVAALVLQKDGSLSPNEVKCRIIASAQTANNGESITYSPFEQGHGMVNALAAVESKASGCANIGLDIAKDLAGTQHYAGPTALDDEGNFIIVGKDGEVLSEGNQWGDFGVLSEGNQWGDFGVLSEGNQWGDFGVLSEGNQWGDFGVLSEGNQWGDFGVLSEGNQWGDFGVLSEGIFTTGNNG